MQTCSYKNAARWNWIPAQTHNHPILAFRLPKKTLVQKSSNVYFLIVVVNIFCSSYVLIVCIRNQIQQIRVPCQNGSPRSSRIIVGGVVSVFMFQFFQKEIPSVSVAAEESQLVVDPFNRTEVWWVKSCTLLYPAGKRKGNGPLSFPG